MLDAVGGRLDAHVGDLIQAHVNKVLRRVDQELLDAGHAFARLGLAPHPHVVHLAVPVDVGDLDAGHDGRCRPTNVAGLEAEVMSGREVHLHFHLRYGPVNLHLQIHEPGDSGQGVLHLSGRLAKDLQIMAIGAHHNRLLASCQHLFDAFLEIRLDVAIEPGVAVDELLNLGQRFVVVHLGVDADPVLGEVDAVRLVAGDGATDVGATVADPRNGDQLFTRFFRDPDHLRMGGAGGGHPVHQEVSFLEVRQQRLSEPGVHDDAGQDDDAHRDIGRPRRANDPGEQSLVLLLEPPRDRGLAALES